MAYGETKSSRVRTRMGGGLSTPLLMVGGGGVHVDRAVLLLLLPM